MPQTHTRPNKVLVVDDDVRIRDLLRRYLMQEGFEVMLAEDGKALNRVLQREAVDIIVLDLMMPQVDGFEFLDALRHHPEWRDIPVVVVTAKDLTEEDHRRLSGGVERILQKDAPTRDEMLREVSATLARCVGRNRARKAARQRN